jgi:hypothetical protein
MEASTVSPKEKRHVNKNVNKFTPKLKTVWNKKSPVPMSNGALVNGNGKGNQLFPMKSIGL